MICPKKCLRCASEVAQFLDLICLIDLKFIAFKCIDCVKKSKSCEDVSSKLFLLTSLLLTSSEVSARLHHLLYELKFAATCFTKDHAF